MIQKLGQKWEIPLGAWKCETGCCVDEAAPLRCESSGEEEQELSRRNEVVLFFLFFFKAAKKHQQYHSVDCARIMGNINI